MFSSEDRLISFPVFPVNPESSTFREVDDHIRWGHEHVQPTGGRIAGGLGFEKSSLRMGAGSGVRSQRSGVRNQRSALRLFSRDLLGARAGSLASMSSPGAGSAQPLPDNDSAGKSSRLKGRRSRLIICAYGTSAGSTLASPGRRKTVPPGMNFVVSNLGFSL
jgi:hypothetical protein